MIRFIHFNALFQNYKLQFGLKLSIKCKQQNGIYTVWDCFRFNDKYSTAANNTGEISIPFEIGINLKNEEGFLQV